MTLATSAPALEVTALRKSFGERVALDGLDLHVASGTIFTSALLTVAWCLLTAFVGARWALRLYDRRPSQS